MTSPTFRIFCPISFILIALFCSNMAFAQVAQTGVHTGVHTASDSEDLTNLSLEDLMKVVVVSASKFPQASSQAPSAVQVLSAEDIRLNGWRTLAEALDSLPGLYASNDRAYGFLGARGFMVPGDYNMRFQLLLDGQPLNDNLYGQANLGHEFQVDMSLIDRIEYVPGPGSSIYGSNAMFGVINVLTRKASSMPRLGASIRIQGDGWKELDLQGAHHSDNGGPDLIFSLSRANKSGRDLYYPDAMGLATADGSASADGIARGLDRMLVTRAFAGIRQDGFAISAWAAQRDVRPSSGLSNGNFNDPRLHIVDTSYALASTYQRRLQQDLDLNFRLAYQKITFQGDVPYYFPSVGSFVIRDQSDGSWLSGEARILYTGLPDHKLIAGLDFQSDLKASQENAALDIPVIAPFSINALKRRLGAFMQDEWNFSTDWRLNIGLRNDTYSDGKSKFSPRLGLIWNSSENATLKLLAGRAYRFANKYEAEYARGVNVLANPYLQPETIRTIEAVASYHIESGQEIGASLFDYQLKNLIRQTNDGNNVLQFQNQADVNAHGLEIFHKLRSKSGINMISSIAFNHSRDISGQELSNSPHWIAKLNLRRPLWQENLVAAIEMNAVGPRRVDWRGEQRHLGTQTQVNLALTASRIAQGLDLQLRLVNLFDKKIAYPSADVTAVPTLATGGRQWQLGLNYAF
ncbi:MAG: TonB-dependent receptor [Pseudomonadota bacterium]